MPINLFMRTRLLKIKDTETETFSLSGPYLKCKTYMASNNLRSNMT